MVVAESEDGGHALSEDWLVAPFVLCSAVP